MPRTVTPMTHRLTRTVRLYESGEYSEDKPRKKGVKPVTVTSRAADAGAHTQAHAAQTQALVVQCWLLPYNLILIAKSRVSTKNSHK